MARSRAALAAVAGAALVVSGCVSATAVDLRLTRAARGAIPREGQAPVRQVADAAECREAILDRLFYAGAYVLYNPLRHRGTDDVLRSLDRDLGRCLRDRGYAVEDPPDAPGAPPKR
jgi:hypothetical protein